MPAAVRSFTATPSSGGVSSLDAPKPTGTTSGDVLYADQFADSSTDGQMTAPAGWSQVGSTASNAGVLYKRWRKIAGGSEPANYTFNCGAGADTLVIIRCVMGADTTTPEDGTPATSTGSAASQGAPSVTTTQTNSLLLCAVASSRATGGLSSYTPPSGMTEEGDVQCSVPFGGYLFGSGASLQLSASGATGTKSFTATSSEAFVAGSVAVRSASGGSPVTLTDTPGHLSLGSPNGALNGAATNVSLTDTPGHAVFTAPATETVLIAVQIVDTPGHLTVGGRDGTIVTGITLTDTPGHAHLGSPDGALNRGLVVTDAPGHVTVGGPDGTVVVGTPGTVTITDTPGHLAMGSPSGALFTGITLTDTPGHATLGGPEGVRQAGVSLTDRPGRIALSGPEGGLTAAGPGGAPAAILTGTVTGPARQPILVSGPAVARAIDGPAPSRTVTGPGA